MVSRIERDYIARLAEAVLAAMPPDRTDAICGRAICGCARCGNGTRGDIVYTGALPPAKGRVVALVEIGGGAPDNRIDRYAMGGDYAGSICGIAACGRSVAGRTERPDYPVFYDRPSYELHVRAPGIGDAAALAQRIRDRIDRTAHIRTSKGPILSIRAGTPRYRMRAASPRHEYIVRIDTEMART